MVDSHFILRRSRWLVIGLIVLALAPLSTITPPAFALDNGLALTPPMGFNDWNSFGCNIDAQDFRDVADYFVSHGLKDAGYEYVNIDDCWMAGRDISRGDATRATVGRDPVTLKYIPDPTYFPDVDENGNGTIDDSEKRNGIKVLADYIHSKGLKIGIYSSAGTTTCQGLMGSLGYESIDAQTFADWGIDYLKLDTCGAHTVTTLDGRSYSYPDTVAGYEARYAVMRDALAASGRDIVFSICDFTTNGQTWTWGEHVGNLWRTTGDISASYSSVLSIFKQNVALAQYAGPGHWNDPDMLEVGNGTGLSTTENRSHFSLWAMMAAPLIIGANLTTISDDALSVLKNADVIAIDQDLLGIQATVASHVGNNWVLAKPLANGDKAVLFFNEGSSVAQQQIALSTLGLGSKKSAYLVRDLWAHENSTVVDTLSAVVAPHGVAMFRVSSSATPSDATPHVSLGGSAAPSYAPAGASTTLTALLTNDGRRSINNVQLSLAAPSGWTIAPVNRAGSAVPGTGNTQASWIVGVPDGTAPGTYSLILTATYSAGDGGSKRIVTAAVDLIVPPPAPTAPAYLSDLAWVSASGTVYKDHSVVSSFGPSGPTTSPGTIKIAGTSYNKGLGTQSGSDIRYYLGGNCSTLTAVLGVDDSAFAFSGTPTAEFQIVADGAVIFDQTIAKGTAVHLNQAISGAQVVELIVIGGSGFGTSADWANAYVTCGS